MPKTPHGNTQEELKKKVREELDKIIPVEGEMQELGKGVDDIATVFMNASMQTQRVPLEALVETYIDKAIALQKKRDAEKIDIATQSLSELQRLLKQNEWATGEVNHVFMGQLHKIATDAIKAIESNN